MGPPGGYFLDFDLIMTDEMEAKFLSAYDILLDLFREARDAQGNWLYTTFEVKFYSQNGGGFHKSNFLSKSYANLGFIKKSIPKLTCTKVCVDSTRNDNTTNSFLS